MTSRRLLSPLAKTLLDAADYMEKHGHCKEVLSDDEGRVCFVGALLHVACDNGDLERASSAVAKVLGLVPEVGWGPGWSAVTKYYQNACVLWNNDPERTAKEVIRTMRTAALECTE